MMKCVLLVLALLGEADGALTLRGAAPLIEDLADAAAGAVAARTHAQSAAAEPVVANIKTLMAGHKDKMDKDMEGAKARAASQETAKAKAVENAKTMMAGHKDKMAKAMEGAKARAAERETAKAKAVENAKTMMAGHAAKMSKIIESATARASVAPRKLLSASAADAKLQGVLVGTFKGLRGGAAPASAIPVADAALGAGSFSQVQAAEKAKTMMAEIGRAHV